MQIGPFLGSRDFRDHQGVDSGPHGVPDLLGLLIRPPPLHVDIYRELVKPVRLGAGRALGLQRGPGACVRSLAISPLIVSFLHSGPCPVHPMMHLKTSGPVVWTGGMVPHKLPPHMSSDPISCPSPLLMATCCPAVSVTYRMYFALNVSLSLAWKLVLSPHLIMSPSK